VSRSLLLACKFGSAVFRLVGSFAEGGVLYTDWLPLCWNLRMLLKGKGAFYSALGWHVLSSAVFGSVLGDFALSTKATCAHMGFCIWAINQGICSAGCTGIRVKT
jgi:hypothetical protein